MNKVYFKGQSYIFGTLQLNFDDWIFARAGKKDYHDYVAFCEKYKKYALFCGDMFYWQVGDWECLKGTFNEYIKRGYYVIIERGECDEFLLNVIKENKIK